MEIQVNHATIVFVGREELVKDGKNWIFNMTMSDSQIEQLFYPDAANEQRAGNNRGRRMDTASDN